MGLDTSHGCWHGAYSAFMRWREKIAEVAGIPPLGLMECFFERGGYRDPLANSPHKETAEAYYRSLPIKWDSLKPSALHTLLHHSDCEGELMWEDCGPIADALEELIPLLPKGDSGGHIGDYRDKTQTFIDGLRLASSRQENVEFH